MPWLGSRHLALLKCQEASIKSFLRELSISSLCHVSVQQGAMSAASVPRVKLLLPGVSASDNYRQGRRCTLSQP